MHIISLVVGDWSDDGHGKAATYTFQCSHTKDQVEEAYSAGITEAQSKILSRIASDYDNTNILNTQLQILSDIGYDISSMEWYTESEKDTDAYITKDEFVDLYWYIVKRGNPEIVYIPAPYDHTINIGGYGFFY